MDKQELAQLTKKERKALLKEERKLQEHTSYKQARIKKWTIIISVIIVGAIGIWLLEKELTKPIPGTMVSDLGRGHIPQEKWEKLKYNSNPPTSGPHDAVWTNAGVYDSPQGDGHLVHSLEHGYIIISYDCTKLSEKRKVKSEKEQADNKCEDLKKQLSDLAEEKRLWKLIVITRPHMDVPIALTAWTYIEKLNAFDKEKISRFIDAHRNQGPEKTME